MAFSHAGNVTVSKSQMNDYSTITNIKNDIKGRRGDWLQMLLDSRSPEASYNSLARYPPPRCDEQTRTSLLEHIYLWISSGEERILFLDGPAGVGKSAIAQTVAAECAQRKILAGSYFFFRGSPLRSTITHFVPTISYDMVNAIPRGKKKVKKSMEEDPSILSKSPDFQIHKLVLEPYQKPRYHFKFWTRKKQYVLIIDGLDECNGDENQRRIVELLGQVADKKQAIVRCLIASRPEPQIVSAISSLPINVTVLRVSLSEDLWDANEDIRTYFRSHFDDLSKRRPESVPCPWPPEETLEKLVKKAGGIFIYASTVLKYVDNDDDSPIMLLNNVLTLPPGITPLAELDQLYQIILMACPQHHRETLLHVFGFIFLRNPDFEDIYDVSLIEAILDLPRGTVDVVLRRMHSILTFITTVESKRTIRFLHASFGDFIFNEERSGQFFINLQRESLFLARKCIDYMSYRTKNADSVIPQNENALVYAWSSWFYHGDQTSGSYFISLLTMLRDCNKTSWTRRFSGGYHQSCEAGLNNGIAWLERKNTESIVSDVLSRLRPLKEEFKWNLCMSIIHNPDILLAVLHVFDNPGLDFFRVIDDALVVLVSDHTHLIPLYLQYQGKIYDLTERQRLGLVSEIPRPAKATSQHGLIAIHCLRSRDRSKSPASQGIQYATKYWMKHVSLVDPTETASLSELRKVVAERTLAELDQLYRQIFEATPSEYRETLLHVIGLAYLRNPTFDMFYNVSLMETLLGIPKGTVEVVCQRMHSILTFKGTGSKREVVLLHASFKSFIFNEGRSGRFYINRQKESLFIATKCLDYMGRLSEVELNGEAIEYSWNSWSYHGECAGDLYFHEVLNKLDNCNMFSWTKRLPVDCPSSWVDGLDSGIKWLQEKKSEGLTDTVLSDLRLVKEELKWSSCERIIASLKAPLTVLRVFENPGFDFFDPIGDFLVVLAQENMPLIPLYFWYSGKLYDLVERSQSRRLPSKIANSGKDICQHGRIALHCIRNLNHDNPTSVMGGKYAAKYWVKHALLADPKDIKIMEELRQAISQRTRLDELDLLYQQVLNACPEKYRVTLLHVIGLLFLANPAFEWTCDISFIESILGLRPGEVDAALERMHLILTVTVNGSRSTIKFLYHSFRDFIFSEARSGIFFIDCQMENYFLAMKCMSYLGHRTQVGLSSMSTNDEAIEYSWNSWFYHGERTSSQFFSNLISHFHRCNKTLWSRPFPIDQHLSCAKGLDSGISWLEARNLESDTSALLSELQIVKRELRWVLYTSVERTSPLQMLHMFADPGAEFFDYGENCVAILRSLGEASTILYFRYNGEVYSLADRNAIYTHPQGKERRGDGLISLLCIRQLTRTNILPSVGLRYAVKYWTKHISLTSLTDGRVLDQLQRIQLRETPKEGRVTPEDARTVIEWLERTSNSRHERAPKLVSLWTAHLQKLESNPDLGLCIL